MGENALIIVFALEIALRYKEKVTDKIIRPLVLIQFPNGQPETIEAVEKKLADMGDAHYMFGRKCVNNSICLGGIIAVFLVDYYNK